MFLGNNKGVIRLTIKQGKIAGREFNSVGRNIGFGVQTLVTKKKRITKMMFLHFILFDTHSTSDVRCMQIYQNGLGPSGPSLGPLFYCGSGRKKA